MYKTSPEIEAIVIRWNEAIRTKDKDSINNMLSASEQLRYVGSAENELWSGALLRRGIGDHFDAVPDFHYRGYNIDAYESGQISWALWTGEIFFPTTGVLSKNRISFVFGLEHGLWKIVQIHISNPSSNMDKIGIEHEALDALMAAAQEGKLGLGREGMATVMFTDVVRGDAPAPLCNATSSQPL